MELYIKLDLLIQLTDIHWYCTAVIMSNYLQHQSWDTTLQH